MTKLIVLYKNGTYQELEYKIAKFLDVREFILELGYEIVCIVHDDIDLTHTIIAKENHYEKEE